MKAMTCRALGGPCDLEHRGDSGDEVIKAQDQHLQEAEAAGDTTHQAAREAMKARWDNPEQAMAWYRGVQETFAACPTADAPTGRPSTRDRAHRHLRTPIEPSNPRTRRS